MPKYRRFANFRVFPESARKMGEWTFGGSPLQENLMTKRRVWGAIIAAVGIAMLFVSSYIKGEVEKGKEQISSAQGTVDTGKKLFGLSPATKPLGDGLASGAQRKIDAGREDVKRYTAIANGFLAGGIVLIVVGGILVFIPQKKS